MAALLLVPGHPVLYSARRELPTQPTPCFAYTSARFGPLAVQRGSSAQTAGPSG